MNKMHVIKCISAFLLVLSAASCQKENAPGHDEGGCIDVKVIATIATDQTKVTYNPDSGDLKQRWAVNDAIVGFDESGTALELHIASASDIALDGSATFTAVTGSGSMPTTEGAKVYFIYAPGKHYTDLGTKTLSVDISSQAADVVPGLMMATGVVSGGTVSLKFTNEMSIIGLSNPTIPLSKGEEISSMTLKNVYTQVDFALDGSGTLTMTPSNLGTITKACTPFTPNATDGTTTTMVYFAVAPNAVAQDLEFTPVCSLAGQSSYKVASKTLESGIFYHAFDRTFPDYMLLDGENLNFSLAANTTDYHIPCGGLIISSGDKSEYSYDSTAGTGAFSGQTGASLFTFSLESGREITQIEITCTGVDLPGKVTGWNFTSPTLSWSGQPAATSVQYTKSITGITQIKFYYQ